MGPAAIAVYLAGALGYAALATAALLSAVAVRRRRPPRPAEAGLVLSGAFVVFLGLSPFPARDAVTCAAPILDPRDVIAPYRHLWQLEAPPAVWLRTLGAIAPVMNFVFYLLPGAFLAMLTQRPRHALAVGAGLSAGVEIAQLTGLFGVYPCPYRYFETADLLLNTAGVGAGFGVVRWWRADGGR